MRAVGTGFERVLRSLVVLALLVDVVMHLRLAPQYQLAAPGGIGAGWLFRIQAIVALLAAVYLLWRGSRVAYAVAALVLFSVLGAVLTYAVVDLPAIGPIPPMYDPLWPPEKVFTVVVEAVGGVLALMGFWWRSRSISAGPHG